MLQSCRVGHGLATEQQQQQTSFHFTSLSFFRSKSVTALLKMYWDFYISSYKPSLQSKALLPNLFEAGLSPLVCQLGCYGLTPLRFSKFFYLVVSVSKAPYFSGLNKVSCSCILDLALILRLQFTSSILDLTFGLRLSLPLRISHQMERVVLFSNSHEL